MLLWRTTKQILSHDKQRNSLMCTRPIRLAFAKKLFEIYNVKLCSSVCDEEFFCSLWSFVKVKCGKKKQIKPADSDNVILKKCNTKRRKSDRLKKNGIWKLVNKTKWSNINTIKAKDGKEKENRALQTYKEIQLIIFYKQWQASNSRFNKHKVLLGKNMNRCTKTYHVKTNETLYRKNILKGPQTQGIYR